MRRQGLFISRRNLFRWAVPSIIAYAATRSKRVGASSSGKTPKRVPPAFGRGEVNLLNFQPAGDGVADDLFAFRRAIASVPPGQPVRVRVPRPPVSYRTTAPITSEGRLVTIVLEDGASLSGVGVLYVDRVERMIGSVVSTELRNMAGGLPGEANLIGKVLRVESRAVAGIGRYYSYDSHVESPTNPNGGDIGFQQVATWHGRSVERPFGMFGAWNVAVSPLTSEADSRRGVAWGCVGVEWNPVYHGPDLGWAGARGEHTWAVGMQVVPKDGRRPATMAAISWPRMSWRPVGGLTRGAPPTPATTRSICHRLGKVPLCRSRTMDFSSNATASRPVGVAFTPMATRRERPRPNRSRRFRPLADGGEASISAKRRSATGTRSC